MTDSQSNIDSGPAASSVPARPVQAVLFAPNEAAAQAGVYDASMAGMARLVDGSTEVALVNDEAVLIVNARGKFDGLPPNGRATRLIDHYRPGFSRADILAGPALLIGIDPETGKPVDLPADVQTVALTV